jgi:threonine/homoserine/homoserine lactone efflux protein
VGDGFTSSLAAFALTSLIIELTPGPNMAYLAALSLSRGTRAGIAAVLGITLGLAIFGVAAAVGVATLILQSTILYESLRWAGVAYLLWLAWEGWASERDVTSNAPASPGDTPWYAFRRGLITNLLNPKAGIFYVATLPRFVDAAAGNVTHQAILLSAIYVSIATLIHLAIVLLAGRLFSLLETPDSRRTTRRVLSLALVGIAVWFAFSTRRG